MKKIFIQIIAIFFLSLSNLYAYDLPHKIIVNSTKLKDIKEQYRYIAAAQSNYPGLKAYTISIEDSPERFVKNNASIIKILVDEREIIQEVEYSFKNSLFDELYEKAIKKYKIEPHKVENPVFIKPQAIWLTPNGVTLIQATNEITTLIYASGEALEHKQRKKED